ncbi:hypothetical protein COEREDRAFT_85645 [Coemansia reversa NRRL 1564]|uniref:Tag1-like fifth Ig-like domain-containing protein n=1 Tax=Coemansia reversa (strain ATCC 12441 / NRRL 1564) TaxID=763665 RepID=A0A2G5BGP9_COERN|nr:hypothetical protein COEREDRAFT_85645 [Coemansia reversa NRRL 1564]|eukprot:PIA18194.1 hypothetical protein COEREDRAFT_85645 [Coemansia reversa NRRL 1564]
MSSADAAVVAASHESEQEPLLPQSPEADQQQSQGTPSLRQSGVILAKRVALVSARYVPPLLGICLATTCLAIGIYLMYIVFHAPAILDVLGRGQPQLKSGSLIDIGDDVVLFSADMAFPRQGRRTAKIFFANATIYHHNVPVGWTCTRDIELTAAQKHLSLYQAFHVVNTRAMERLLGEAASLRRVTVSTRAEVDLRGFGKYLPMAFFHREMNIALPLPLPALNATIRDFKGPVADPHQGGVSAQASVQLNLPANISANINPVWLDVSYRNIKLATVKLGPISIHGSGMGNALVGVNVKHISGRAHEEALADIARKAASGQRPELSVSGAPPSQYDSAPLWLRRALHDIIMPVGSDLICLSGLNLPSVTDLVNNVVFERLYAYWSAEDSYRPWLDVSGRTMIKIPNTSATNVTIEAESLVYNLQLLDGEQQAFATVDVSTAPLKIRQDLPMQFIISYDYERLGLSALPGKELQFTRAMKRALVDRRIAASVNGSLDISLNTSIGRLRIDALPLHVDMDWKLESGSNVRTGAPALVSLESRGAAGAGSSATISVARIHIVETRPELIKLKLGLNINNPFSYGASIADLALMVKFSGLHVATIGVNSLKLSQGLNKVAVDIDFHNHPDDPRQQTLFLDASSGRTMTIEVAGFPGCTTIRPLEAALRSFSQKITVDTSKLGSSGDDDHSHAVGTFPQVLQEVVFHLFAMSAEATVINPVSGADIWLQAIEAIGYYDGNVPLGTLEYDFMRGQPRQRLSRSNGLLLPYNQATTTPRLPIKANKTSIGWDVLQRAIGGTLDVDVFTNIQVLVGNAPLNVTVMGKNAPVKIRL